MIFLYPELLLVIFGFFVYLVCKNRLIQVNSKYTNFTINNFNFVSDKLKVSEKFRNSIKLLTLFSLATLVMLSTAIDIKVSNYNYYLWDNVFLVSNFEILLKIALLLFFFIYILFFCLNDDFPQYKNYILSQTKYKKSSFLFTSEFLLLVSLFCVAGCFFISAENFFLVFLSKECQTLILCFLIIYCNTKYSSKSALYFFFQAAFYSFMFLLGMAIIYFEIGTLDFNYILDYILLFKASDLSIFWLKVGFIFILCSFGFKLGVPPFNFWVLNVFSVMPRMVIYVVSILSKIVVFTFFLKLNFVFYCLFEFDLNFFALIGIFSLIYSSVAGLIEYNLFRIYAYSSFNHLGLLLLGLSFNNLIGVFAVLFYLVVYLLNSLFFLVLSLYKKNFINIHSFSYHFHVDPWFSVVFCIILFSMSGIPPFLGFFPKMLIGAMLYNYSLIISPNYYVYLFIFIITASLVIFLYLRIVRVIFFGGYKHLKFYNYSFPSSSGYDNMLVLYAVLLLNIIILISVGWVFGFLFEYLYYVY